MPILSVPFCRVASYVRAILCSSCCCFCQHPHPGCLLPHQGTLGSWHGASSPGLAEVSIPAEQPQTPRGARGCFSCRKGHALQGSQGCQGVGYLGCEVPFSLAFTALAAWWRRQLREHPVKIPALRQSPINFLE